MSTPESFTAEKKEPGFYWVKRYPDAPWEPVQLDSEGRWWLGDELWSWSEQGFSCVGPRLTPPE